MRHINRKRLGWVVAVLAIAVVAVGSATGTGQAIDTTDAYPAPPVALNGGQQAVLSISNMAAATCHAKLVFSSVRDGALNSETIDVAAGHIRSFAYTPRIASTSRLTLLAYIVSVNASCKAFAGSLQVVDVETKHSLQIVAVGDTLG